MWCMIQQEKWAGVKNWDFFVEELWHDHKAKLADACFDAMDESQKRHSGRVSMPKHKHGLWGK